MFTFKRKSCNLVNVLWFGENPHDGGIDDPKKYNTPKSPVDVAKGEQVDDTRSKSPENKDKDEEFNINPLIEQQQMEKSRKKGAEIAKNTQAPATNPDQTEAARIGLQQKEALSQTFP